MPKKLTFVDKLQRKLDEELDNFKKELLKLPPEELLGRAVECGIRQQLSETPWTCGISAKQAKALLTLPNTLDALYCEFEKDPGPYLDGMEVIADREVDRVFEESQQAQDPGPTMQL